jgi:hypothetical protein
MTIGPDRIEFLSAPPVRSEDDLAACRRERFRGRAARSCCRQQSDEGGEAVWPTQKSFCSFIAAPISPLTFSLPVI